LPTLIQAVAYRKKTHKATSGPTSAFPIFGYPFSWFYDLRRTITEFIKRHVEKKARSSSRHRFGPVFGHVERFRGTVSR
jgi:hypothetical protein